MTIDPTGADDGRASSGDRPQPSDSPGFLLWHSTLRWQRAVASALRPWGLTHVQFVLLACAWWLVRAGHRPNQVELAEAAGTDVKMTSEVVRRLEARGLLVRAPDAADSRMKRLDVTPEGHRLAAATIEAVEAADRAFFAGVDDLPGLVAALRATSRGALGAAPGGVAEGRRPGSAESRT